MSHSKGTLLRPESGQARDVTGGSMWHCCVRPEISRVVAARIFVGTHESALRPVFNYLHLATLYKNPECPALGPGQVQGEVPRLRHYSYHSLISLHEDYLESPCSNIY